MLVSLEGAYQNLVRPQLSQTAKTELPNQAVLQAQEAWILVSDLETNQKT